MHPSIQLRKSASGRTSPISWPNDDDASENRIPARTTRLLAVMFTGALPLVVLGGALLLVQPCAAAPGEWENTGSLARPRAYQTATLLPNGKVLVAGGWDSPLHPIASAELYDPASGTWTTTASLARGRYSHTATLLPNGKVLVAGGDTDRQGVYLATAELYDPVERDLDHDRQPCRGTHGSHGDVAAERQGARRRRATLPATPRAPNSTIRPAEPGRHRQFRHCREPRTRRHCCPMGRCLWQAVSAAAATSRARNSTTPPTETWTTTGSMATARQDHTATLLANGKPLVAGGRNGSRYSRARNCTTRPTGLGPTTGNLHTARYGHTATLLANGKVLVAGGSKLQLRRARERGTLRPVQQGLGHHRQPPYRSLWSHRDLADNGKVLVAGGTTFSSGVLASAELYDPGLRTKVDGRGSIDNQGNEVSFNFRALSPMRAASSVIFPFAIRLPVSAEKEAKFGVSPSLAIPPNLAARVIWTTGAESRSM